MTTWASAFRDRAGDDHVGLRFGDDSWTWAEVVRESEARAAMALDLRRDGPFHIGVLLDNVPDFLFWIGGAALAGATVVGINPTRRGAELAGDIRHTDCQLIVTDGAHRELFNGLDLGIAPGRVIQVDGVAYAAMLAEYAGATVDVDVGEDSNAMLLFTSGSTGAPKAVICTSGRLGGIAEITARMYGMTPDEVGYIAMPLFHGNAVMANLAPALKAGATIVLRPKFSASGWLPDVRKYGVTYFTYVGRALAYILATPETPEDKDNKLRLGFGTEATAQDRARFTERFGCPLVESYGSSEGGVSIVAKRGTPPGALGLPRDETDDVVIVDPETNAECPRAVFDDSGRLVNGDVAIGEMVNRNGAPTFEGYYRSPEAEAERVHDGWYWTGDLGYRDAEGFFYFAGRSADRLRVDSENFSAAPIERILERHPAVAVAAVYPVPDSRTGDQVMAALELVPGEALTPESLDEFLAAQSDLGTKWAPRYVRIVAAMPVTANGKVAKTGLRPQRWDTDDPVWWHPDKTSAYRPLTEEDRIALATEFEANARTDLL